MQLTKKNRLEISDTTLKTNYFTKCTLYKKQSKYQRQLNKELYSNSIRTIIVCETIKELKLRIKILEAIYKDPNLYTLQLIP